MLVREGTESVGTEVDEGFHVVFGEAAEGYFGHMVPFHLSVLLQLAIRGSEIHGCASTYIALWWLASYCRLGPDPAWLLIS